MKLTKRVAEAVLYLKRPLLGLGLALTVALSTGLTAQAATTPAGSASGLSISPLRQELTLKPGQADEISITLKNITGGPITAKVAVQDFESDNLTGNPKIITDPKANNPASIRNFLVGLGNIPLATGEQKTFTIPVQAPANAAPGAYYGLIEYQAIPVNNSNQGGNSQVGLSAAVSQLVFITVPGNITQRMEINGIHVYRDKLGTKEGLFFTSPPKTDGIMLTNLGNGFAKPFGRISVQNSSGKEIYAYQLNGGITPELVLPHSSRLFINGISNIKRPGRYTIVANISYGSGSAILTGKKTFWYIPAWLPAAVIVVLALLAGAAVLARRRYKRGPGHQYHR